MFCPFGCMNFSFLPCFSGTDSSGTHSANIVGLNVDTNTVICNLNMRTLSS